MHRVLVVLSLVIFGGARLALAQDVGYADLTICNKGTVHVSVVLAAEADDLLSGYTLDVDGWYVVAPRECKHMVHIQGAAGEKTNPVFLGFAFFDQKGQFTTGRAAQAPDLGLWYSNWVQAARSGTSGPVLSRSTQTICVSRDEIGYRITTRAAVNCATFRPAGSAGPFLALVAALRFQPAASKIVPLGPELQSVGGDYYLNVAPKANDLELHASKGTESGDDTRTAGDSNEPSLLKDFLDAARRTGEAESARKRAEETRRVEANRKVAEARARNPLWIEYEKQQQAKWGAPRLSAGDYSAQWMGKQMHVSGTVARASVAYGSPSWLTLHFSDSPNGAFVLCSPSPSIFTGLFGDDLNALVGKKIEAIGEVESPLCGGASGSIRVLDSDSVRLLQGTK